LAFLVFERMGGSVAQCRGAAWRLGHCHGFRVVAPAPTKQYSSSVQKKVQMRTIEKPTYLLESVDNALRLLQSLILHTRIM
jgi:hypothetical protein